jgi:hypothetical protein
MLYVEHKKVVNKESGIHQYCIHIDKLEDGMVCLVSETACKTSMTLQRQN